ncbi:MAG TPA: DUF1318 domain-containing protein [Myxococcota bacterium]|nr:DUF1318 domain-containing protein [Myxococcota bacterium]
MITDGLKRVTAAARRPLLGVAAAAGVGAGCITVHAVNIGQKTSLEMQLMGEFEPLSEEEQLAASVRAGPDAPSAARGDLEAAAVAARQRQLFNRDDLRTLKGAGCVGEALAAKLASRPCAKDAEVEALRARLVAEENADRAAIMVWAVEVDPVLTRRDMPQVAAVFHRLLLEQAQKGEHVQNDDGAWTVR